MNIKHIDTLTIVSAYLPALINDDYSGLSDLDCEIVEVYAKSLPNYAILDTKDRETEFAICDLCGMWGDCVQVDVYAPVEEVA